MNRKWEKEEEEEEENSRSCMAKPFEVRFVWHESFFVNAHDRLLLTHLQRTHTHNNRKRKKKIFCTNGWNEMNALCELNRFHFPFALLLLSYIVVVGFRFVRLVSVEFV